MDRKCHHEDDDDNYEDNDWDDNDADDNGDSDNKDKSRYDFRVLVERQVIRRRKYPKSRRLFSRKSMWLCSLACPLLRLSLIHI